MLLQFIVCQVLQREAYYVAARSKNVVEVVLLPQGLHNEPDKLRAEVQKALDRDHDAHGRAFDATLLGYALCSNGIVGLHARIPLIVPRGHDCVTLLLGSRKRYQEYFDSHPGIYWYSAGWIEHSLQPGKERFDTILRQYREKYGEENAEYLFEMEQKWMREYSWATYIDWGFPDSARYRDFTRECADYLKWKYDEMPGDPGLLQKLVDGEWDEESFLTVPPGKKIAADVTHPGIVKAE